MLEVHQLAQTTPSFTDMCSSLSFTSSTNRCFFSISWSMRAVSRSRKSAMAFWVSRSGCGRNAQDEVSVFRRRFAEPTDLKKFRLSNMLFWTSDGSAEAAQIRRNACLEALYAWLTHDASNIDRILPTAFFTFQSASQLCNPKSPAENLICRPFERLVTSASSIESFPYHFRELWIIESSSASRSLPSVGGERRLRRD